MLCFQTQTSKMLSHSLTAFLTYLRYYLLLHLVQKAKFLSSSNVKATLRWLSFFGGVGGGCAEAKICRFFSEKRIHKALRSVQFLVPFISFYFEILSYLACGEKLIRLASKK